MFATVLGAIPRPPSKTDEPLGDDDAVRAVIAAQEAAGLDLLTDGRIRWSDELGLGLASELVGSGSTERLVDEWLFAHTAATRPVKQSLPGPYTAGRRLSDRAPARDRRREQLTETIAARLNAAVRSLTDAGCVFIEVEEADAGEIGEDEAERALFVRAHRRLTGDASGVHLSLALTRGSADRAGTATFLDAPYASYALDVIVGPDNWRLAPRFPGERGIVCGALDARASSDDTRELLVWAANYAASTGRRGLDRVGLAIVPGLVKQDWTTVERKLTRLGEAARLAALSGEELKSEMDPRAVDIRSAALGRYEPGHGELRGNEPGRNRPRRRPRRPR